MTARTAFDAIVAALEETGIPFMVTGSFASSLLGSPRATQDLDLVITPSAPALEKLVERLSSEGFYVELSSALTALARRSHFNAIHSTSGFKADLIIRKERPFSVSEFERRATVDLLGHRVAMVTAEDLVVAKVEWAALGGSRRQLEDVVAILRNRDELLDRQYMEHWIRELGLGETWGEVETLLRRT